MQLYIVEKNINANFAFYSVRFTQFQQSSCPLNLNKHYQVSLINGLGVPARILVALFAQKFGLWNSSTFVTAVMAVGSWAILGL